jgi:hypothetical protein
MMLGDVQTIEPGLIGRLYEREPFVEQLRHRPVRIFDVVEKSDLHGSLLICVSIMCV